MRPVLQVALDFLNLERAVKLAREAVAGGADWLEAGTPLIKSEGLESVRRLRAEFPEHTIVADLKTMDAGRLEMEAAAKAGASVAIVLGVASDSTIKECVEAGLSYGIEVGVDLVGTADPAARARQVAEWGVAQIHVHTPIDEQMEGVEPFQLLEQVASAVSIPVAVAGGINSETAATAIEAGAQIVVIGGAISKAADATAATRQLREAVDTGVSVATDLYKRTTGTNLRELLGKVSTANVSDGSHRGPAMRGISPVGPGLRAVGPALTVRTYPGDWAKPVQAIDRAQPGEVVVIDAGGVGPALWGELATQSALQRGLAGAVVDGAIRDVAEIRNLGFPVFTRLAMPTAGEPKGLGEIGVPVTVGGLRVCSGDWILADDDGVMVLPKARAVEMANRALDCLERENRIRQEIVSGHTTLGAVTELLKWEKK